MNIETKTQTTYVLTLTDADIAEIMAFPGRFARHLEKLRDTHGAATIPALAPMAERPARKHPKPRKEKAAASPKGPAGKGGFAKSPCPECGQLVAGSQMKTHRQRKHGVPDAKLSASN